MTRRRVVQAGALADTGVRSRKARAASVIGNSARSDRKKRESEYDGPESDADNRRRRGSPLSLNEIATQSRLHE
jgi:hypothetical protein